MLLKKKKSKQTKIPTTTIKTQPKIRYDPLHSKVRYKHTRNITRKREKYNYLISGPGSFYSILFIFMT